MIDHDYGEKIKCIIFFYCRILFNSIMFVHLAKRIAMPGETAVTKCGWNAVDGYVSAGCADGLVKVLKLEIPESKRIILVSFFTYQII
jgi:hypothetical protein